MRWISSLIVGLGNPGSEYQCNRHNVGFQCVNRLAKLHGLKFDRKKGKAKVAQGVIAQKKVIIAKPRTFMNLSGKAVKKLLSAYEIPLEQLLVIYDDLDLPPGKIRLRSAGGAGGHNGMRSIIAALQTQEFARLRVGIGRPPGRQEPHDYVLEDFTLDERELFAKVYEQVAAAIEMFLSAGIDAAMNEFNKSELSAR